MEILAPAKGELGLPQRPVNWADILAYTYINEWAPKIIYRALPCRSLARTAAGIPSWRYAG
jgi:hypothetical protein